MKPDCLFCKLAHDDSSAIWQTPDFAAFPDIHPKARLHLLIVPKQHTDSFDDIPADMAPGLVAAIQTVARLQGVSGAYQVHVNVGRKAGQEVDHLHVHLLAD
jgi:histidine triad (HIT) family protein